MQVAAIRRQFIDYFVAKGHTLVPQLLAGARQRSDAAVRQLGHGPVQGSVPGHRKAQLRARHVGAALPARRRQAQRPRERRLHGAASHVFRDARQLVVRRLLQARRDPLRVGAADQDLRPAAREAVGHRLHRRRRGLRHLDEGDRRARRTRRAHRRQQGRQIRERQLLADGRHRPVRTVLGDLLRPRSGSVGRAAGIAGRRRRPLHRDLESRVHAVRPADERGGKSPDPAAEAVRRHRDGARAAGGGIAARPLELRDRSLCRADQGGRARDAHDRPRQSVAQGHRRSHPRLRIPDRRRRDSEQRRPRLRAAPDHPPRDPPRLPAGTEAAVLPQAGRGSRRANGRCVSGAHERQSARRAGAGRGRGALRRNARERDENPERRAGRAREDGRQDARRRNRVHALRHVRLSARPDRRHLPQPWRDGRRGGFRSRDERAARPGARRVGVQDGRAARVRRAEDGVPRLRDVVRRRTRGRAVQGRRQSRCADDGRARDRGARPHAVLRGVGRAGRRSRRAVEGRHVPHAVRGRRYAEDPARRIRTCRRREDGRAESRRHGGGAGRPRRARPHDAQPFGHAPDAQGVARGAGTARPAEGLAGGSGQDALRFRAQRAADR